MQVHRNTFDGGLETNIVRSLVPSNKYINAENVNLTSVGGFYSLENVKGTTGLKDIASVTNQKVLGAYAVDFEVAGVLGNPGLLLFTALDDTINSSFRIYGYILETNTLYEMYEESIEDYTEYFTSDRVVDAVLYPENGLDIVYFTDNIREPRKVICSIPSVYTANFLTELDIKLTRLGASGTIEAAPVLNGSLLCGSYQVAYQLLNPDTGQYTKFSLLTNPVQIWNSSNKRSFLISDVTSGVGVQSNRSLSVTITPSEQELDYYTHFRLAVVENIQPDGVNVAKAQLTKTSAISDFLVGDTIECHYRSNSNLETIDLSEIVVDQLAIEYFKTLTVRQNRLVAGNVKYRDLEYDNGTPEIGSGSIIRQDASYVAPFIDPDFATRYRGYFREELYRFAISYYDENGNFSFPQMLDMSTITHNQAAALEGTTSKDMKFPARSSAFSGVTYTLMNESDRIQSLGLQLNDITNHPSWAAGAVILRAPRIKKVLFQTPIIPMSSTFGNGAIEDYPTTPNTLSGNNVVEGEVQDLQPMGPFDTYTPRNYFWKNKQDVVQVKITGGATGSNANKQFTGESKLLKNENFNVGMIFPDSYMYGNKSFTFSPSYSFNYIDAALVQMRYTDYSDFTIGSTEHGRNIKTSVAATFYALDDDRYYYNYGHSGAKTTLASSTTYYPVSYKEFVNFGEGGSLEELAVLRYDKLDTPGAAWGNKGNVHKCAVVKFNDDFPEINNDSALVFASGSQISKSSAVDPEFHLNNGQSVQTILIANMVTPVTDQRYGNTDFPHEFISTGSVIVFSEAEKATLQAGGSVSKSVEVWGGDCYVAPHLFKLTDTVYGVSHSEKFDGTGGVGINNATYNWERSYDDLADGTNCALSITVPYKNAAQYVELVLESEYNGQVMDNEIVDVIGTAGPGGFFTFDAPIFGLSSTMEDSCRIPLTYQLNHNHKKENDIKVFRVKDPLISQTTHFKSRIIYSDQKVYQTAINGFDVFRVGNIYDLSETFGKITAVKTVGDNLFALQDKAITYLGIGERVLETTDALTLSVQSGNFIGTEILVDSNKGTQHLKSVLSTGNLLYFVDARNLMVCRLVDKSLEIISEPAVASTFRSVLNADIPETDLRTIHDVANKQIWFANIGTGSFSYVYDEPRNIWVSNLTFGDNMLYDGVYQGSNLYTIGNNVSLLNIGSMYTGDRGTLLTNYVTPRVTFVANPNIPLSKVYNDILVSANNPLATLEVTVERDSVLGNQTSSGINLDVTTRGEGNYRAKILRDSNGARLRGLYGLVTLNWKTGASSLPKLNVTEALTKYEISDNRF